MYHRYWVLVAASVIGALGVGYLTESAAIGMLVFLTVAPLAVVAVLFGPHRGRLYGGIGPPAPITGPLAALIGQQATVLAHAEGGLWVRLNDDEWPARLPPFTLRPPIGSLVTVGYVADGILVVHPHLPPNP